MYSDVFNFFQTPATNTLEFSTSFMFSFCRLELVGLWSFEDFQ